jgi:hypothetical protein
MTAPTPEFKVEVRDKFLNMVGELDDYQSLDLRLRFNDVSTWQITLRRTNRLAPQLTAPGAGIVVRRVGSEQVVLSGFWTEQSHERSDTANTLTVSGVDDTGWLFRRMAHPAPDEGSPPYTTQPEDTRTGLASTLIQQFVQENAGPTALTPRRVYGLLMGTDPLIGPTLTFSGRWQNLLTLVQQIATASEQGGTPIGFVAQQDDNNIRFFSYTVPDLTGSVRFSHGLNNLASFSYKVTAPTGNYAIVGGEGEGTARTYVEKPDSESIAEWGRIESDLADSRNAVNTTEMEAAADVNLAETASTTSLAIVPMDTPDQQYGVHYTLGCKVTVLFDTIGQAEEVVTAVAVAQGSAVTGGYLIALENDGLAFPSGTRVRVYDSTGQLKEPGVRAVTGRTTAFGYTNIDFVPPLTTGTVAGDYLEAFEVIEASTSGSIQDIIREVSISVTNEGVKVQPSIGGTANIRATKVFQALRRLTRRVINLEGR